MPAPLTQFFPASNPDGKSTRRISYYDWGSPDAQRVAVCVHGLTRNARDFDFLAEHLITQDYRVIAISMAGRGESEWLADPMHYHYGTYVADCLALLNIFHLRNVDWIGTSMGGIIGMMLAASNPGRVRKLVLNDIGSFLEKSALERIYSYVRTIPISFANRAEAEAYLRKNFAPWGITEETHWQAFIAISLREAEGGAWQLLCDPNIAVPLAVASNNFTEITDVNLAEIWLKLKIPALVLRGESSDILMPYTVDAMKSTNPRAESRVIAGCGHAPALASPEQLSLISQWLKSAQHFPMAAGM